MATADTSTVSALLQNVYLPGIVSWVNQQRAVRRRLDKITDKKKFRGSKFVMAANVGHGQGIGSPSEGSTVPTAGTEQLVNMELTMQQHYAVIRLSAKLMATAGQPDGSFEDALDSHVMGAKDELEQDLAFHSTYGSGHGDLGEVSAYSGTSLTMKTQPTTVGAMGTRYIRPNMTVDSYTAKAGGTQNADSVTISAVTNSTAIATVPASSGFVAGDFVFRKDSRGNVTMGLGGIVDEGTRVATFQTLSRTTYPLLKANLLGNSGTLRQVTPALMDQLCSEANNNGGGQWPTMLISPMEIQQRVADYIRSDRRADMGTMELDNGYQSVAWTCPNGKVPWQTDQNCRTNEVMAVHEPDLFYAILQDVQWETRDGSNLRITDRVHAFEAWLWTMQNMGATRCNSSSVLRDCSHTL